MIIYKYVPQIFPSKFEGEFLMTVINKIIGLLNGYYFEYSG